MTEPAAPSEPRRSWHPSTDEVVSVLGEGWVEGSGPLYEKLASSLQSAIEYGHLPPGTSLPSERALAQALFVSRNTVVAAYGRLRAIGVVDSRRGSGTWVRGRAAGRFGDEETLGMLTRDPYLSTFIDENPVPIDLTIRRHAPPSTSSRRACCSPAPAPNSSRRRPRSAINHGASHPSGGRSPPISNHEGFRPPRTTC